MKNNYLNWMVIIMVAIMSVSFESCGDDDDDNQSDGNQNEVIQNLMSHKWTGSSTDYDVYSYGTSTYTQTWTVYFTSEHEGVMHVKVVDRDSSLGTSRSEEHIDFSYSVDGNKVRLYGGSNFVFDYYGSYMMEGDDIFASSALTSSDYTYLREHKNGYHGNEGEIKADMIFEMSLYNTVDYSQQNDNATRGWYMYNIDYRVGATTDAYKKGVSRMRVTVWASNASCASLKTSDYGKKHSETFNLSSTDLTFLDRLPMLSKERSIILNYVVEYYNSKDNSWYVFREGKNSFSI